MKRIVSIALATLLLAGCAAQPSAPQESSADATTVATTEAVTTTVPVGEQTTAPTTEQTTAEEKPTTDGTTATKTEATTTVTTAAPTTTQPKKEYNTLQLIPDADFYNGLTVLSQKDHANGDRVTELGDFYYTRSMEDPVWTLAQWDSGPCIWKDRVDSDKTTLTDGVSKWVTYDPKQKSLLLRMDTEAYYQGKGAVQGDYWPHLLIQQNFPYSSASASEKKFYTGAADKWMLSFDLRMPYYKATPNPDNWVEAAQLYMYFGAHEKKTGRFVWFGLQMFDSRYELSGDSYHVDGGKADASGQMIYVIGMGNVYQNVEKSFWNEIGTEPQVTNDWIHFELDLIPHLQNMLDRGIREGDFPEGTTVDDFYIDYMNYGWEIIATYDCGVEIKNLSLLSCIEK